MDALEAIRKRRSIRRFRADAVPKIDLERIVDAGRLAATGSNRQPWDFVIVTERDKIVQFKSAGAWIASAAVVIVVVMDPSSRWWVEDGAAAIENMLPACSGALRSLEVKKWNSAMIPSKFPDNEIVNFCLLRLS